MKPIVLAAVIAAFSSSAAWCSSYTFTQVSPNNQAVNIYFGAAINSSGEVVWINGQSAEVDNGNIVSSYTLSAGNISEENIGLSDAGGISFSYFSNTGLVGAVYSVPGGSLTTFQYPGQSETYAGGSSASGLVAGDYAGNTGWIWNGGSSFTTINYPGTHAQVYLNGVNNAGAVVGESSCCNSGVGFIEQNGVATTITVPGETNGNVEPENLNNADTVVGGAYNPQNHYDGFVWQNGTASIVDYPGATETILYGIDSAGEIVGEADFGNSSDAIVFTATLGSSTPEPASLYLLLGAGLVSCAVRFRPR